MAIAKIKNGFAANPGDITVYNYDGLTGEYLGENVEFLNMGQSIPANSTTIEPLASVEGFAVVYKDDKWQNVTDKRGSVVYNKKTREPEIIDYIGEIDDDFTELEPQTQFDEWAKNQWVTNKEKKSEYEKSQNEVKKNSLLDEATRSIAPLQDAVDIGDITEDEQKRLTQWKIYRVALMRVDVSNPKWPEKPE